MGSKYCFSRVILLGSGKLAWQCAVECKKYLEDVEVLEYRITDSTVLQKLCQKSGIRYLCCAREQLYERLSTAAAELSAAAEEALVVSAGNSWIIPKEIVGKENLYIINWHNALLPLHKGRNAEAWSIYAGDTQTGITWHRLTAAIDAGDIILQRSLKIDHHITALELFQRQCEMGAESFREILEPLLFRRCELHPQQNGESGSMHYSRKTYSSCEMHYSHEVPNGGYLDLAWGAEQMSRFLRAMDYGGLMLLGEMHVRWQGREYRFRKYQIARADVPDAGVAGADASDAEVARADVPEVVVWQGQDMVIYKDGQQITLKRLKEES